MKSLVLAVVTVMALSASFFLPLADSPSTSKVCLKTIADKEELIRLDNRTFGLELLMMQLKDASDSDITQAIEQEKARLARAKEYSEMLRRTNCKAVEADDTM